MMKKSKAALVAAGTVAVLGTGFGIAATAQAETPTPSPSSTSTAKPAQPGQAQPGQDRGKGGRHGGQRDGNLAAELATKLGKTEAEVQTALNTYREANRPTTPSGTASPSTTAPARPSQTEQDAALAKALATSLKVDEAKVTQALKDIRAARVAEQKAELKTRLDAAVKANKLTQAEADAVLKAADAGVSGYGAKGGHR